MSDPIQHHSPIKESIETISVLVVDDDQSVVATTSEILEALGYRVHTATCGQQARNLYQADPNAYDLVLSDVRMPGMNGFELARRLRSVDPTVPILLMTGDRVRTCDAANTHPEGILCKPFGVSELEIAILDALGMN